MNTSKKIMLASITSLAFFYGIGIGILWKLGAEGEAGLLAFAFLFLVYVVCSFWSID